MVRPRAIVRYRDGDRTAVKADALGTEKSSQRPGPLELRTIAGRSLTAREQEVGALLIRGCSNREIATRLGVSEHTVKTQVGRLYAKVGVKSRLQFVMRALRT